MYIRSSLGSCGRSPRLPIQLNCPLSLKPAHHLHRAALVHREAHQLVVGVDHFPEPALLLLPDRVAGPGSGGGSLGLALLGHRDLRSS